MEIKFTYVLFNRKYVLQTIMRSFIFLCCISVFGFSPSKGLSQNSRITIKSNEIISIDRVFDIIQEQTTYKFIYSLNLFDNAPKVNVKKGKTTVLKLLNKSFSESDLTYSIIENTIVLSRKSSTSNSTSIQQVTIKGKVTDKYGEPLPGVNVLVGKKGSKTLKGITTDFEGNYNVQASIGEIITFSYIGFITKEFEITSETKTINVVLSTSVNQLNEVVITGYQKVDIEKSTGSSATVNAVDVEKRGRSNLANSLEGLVPGLGLTSDPNNEGAKKIDIRGISTINGNSTPLIIVDGFPVTTDISQINPYDVESVTVLKDAGAASIYGAQASNGVIVIETKKGKKGSLNVNYTTNVTFNQKPDFSYRLNRLSSSDLVDAQIIGAQNTPAYDAHSYQWILENNHWNDYPQARTSVFNATVNAQDGLISQAEADAIINPLRNIDNIGQISEYFAQNPLEQQHNLSLSGGGENNVFRATLNYTTNKTSFVGDKSDRTIFDFNNSTDISDKVKLDINGNFTISDSESIPYNRDIVLSQVSSYELFADSNGNPLPVTVGNVGEFRAFSSGGIFGGKDPIEIQRLIDLGLYDETYYPLDELNQYSSNANGLSTRLQAMLRADLVKGLKGTFGFQYQKGSNRSTRIASEESFEMRSIINNTAPIDFTGDNTTLNIPRGGRIIESRSDSQSYTARAQLDYDASFNKHNIRVLAGTEVRHVFNSAITTDRFGYNEFSLNTIDVDKYRLGTDGLGTIPDVNHPVGQISGGLNFNDAISENTNRYFSAYGNMSYDFDNKYVVTGSMRLDQSNLFGTDPKYRYKPFWSVGAKWNIQKEDFFDVDFIDRLALRVTHGINGNIANNYGPFDIAQYSLPFRAGSVEGLEIVSPAIKNLRWERTQITNVGIDATLFNNKVRLGVDYYRKNTSDILSFGDNDPVNGKSYVMKNDATITNDGIEVSLGGTIISSNDFTWNSNIIFRHNKNKVEKVALDDIAPIFLSYSPQNLEGYPANSFYVFDWAGLDENGNVTINTHNGEVKTVEGYFSPYNDVVKEDLVYAGSINPTFTGSFTNNFNYKNFNLSFMFVTNQGHKLMKDTYNGETIGSQPQNINADAANAWEQPGDEEFTDIPALSKSSSAAYTSVFARNSTKNIIDGGFIRLREVILSYSLPSDILKKMGIKNLSFNVRGNNLWLIAKNDEGIDPESQGIGVRYFPVQPSYTVGLNLNF